MRRRSARAASSRPSGILSGRSDAINRNELRSLAPAATERVLQLALVLTVRFFKSIGRKGAQARIDNSTAEQRQKWARNAAIARWKKGAS